MGNGFHLTLMTFRQLTFALCPDDDDADKDGDDGEDDNGKGSHRLKKTFFYEKLSQNGDPPPYCICEILIQIFLP